MKPVEIAIEAWWVVQAGYITEDDIKVRSYRLRPEEKEKLKPEFLFLNLKFLVILHNVFRSMHMVCLHCFVFPAGRMRTPAQELFWIHR